MPTLALFAVLLAAAAHATWNYFAKSAAASKHFVWLYSTGSLLLYAPVVGWVLFVERPQLTGLHALAMLGTGVLHLGYSICLQAGYRTSDLSLVYPIARGSGPLLSFIAATIVLNERATWLSALGLVLIVTGILLIAGFTHRTHKAPKLGVLYGLLSGVFIAGYTVNDGWAVKVLLLSPFLIDFTGSLSRSVVLGPFAWRDRVRVKQELKTYLWPVTVVSVLGPVGYILVLFAMRVAPVSHVAPARELATLLGAYLGSRVLKEESAPQRIAGAACIVGGVVSLAFASPA
jgi:drug/metabolite transporter (DMT)-like permease